VILGTSEPAVQIDEVGQWQQWLTAHADSESVIWTVILKKSTRRQTVTMDELLEEALCWGWVDVRTKTVDDERYGIRFVPRREGGNWTQGNRAIACRLIADGRMQPSGSRKLPVDLKCDGL
jgi:uncharacterized protein YdeI (YjbR/CyaY-like superfamily)